MTPAWPLMSAIDIKGFLFSAPTFNLLFMNIIINEDLKAYIDPLSPEEYNALESSLLAEGCRDALVMWGNVLVDGHNRFGICQKHGLPFQTIQHTRFQSMEDVHLWMIDQHLGRRSVSDYQRGVLALRKKDILTARAQATAKTALAEDVEGLEQGAEILPWEEGPATIHPAPPALTREALAKAARLSNTQVGMIEKIQKQAAPEVVAAVRSGSISINAAAAVATLPAEEQIAIAQAGKDELKLAAKRVREARRKPRDEAVLPEGNPSEQSVHTLQLRIDELMAENRILRQQLAELQDRLAGGSPI